MLCDFCDLQKVCRVLQLSGNGLPCGRMHIVEKGGTMYRAGERVEHLYTVRQGLLKSVVRDADRTRLVSVHVPGEALGVSAIETRTLASDIVAVTPTIYCSLPLAAFTPENYERFPHFAAAVSQLRASESATRQKAASGTLSERVRAFFTNISERLAERGLDSDGIECDIPREELVHHFRCSHNALERALVDAADLGAIHLHENRITLGRHAPASTQTRRRSSRRRPAAAHRIVAQI